jgi:hypothetical protein
MEVLLGVLAVGAMLSIPVVGIGVATVAIAAFDFPSGSQDVAADALSSGAWVAVLAVALVVLAGGLYAVKRQRESGLAGPKAAP